MSRGLYTAAAGMYVQQQRVDVLANNMANADTTGFKRETTLIEEFAPYVWANLRNMTEKRPQLSMERVLGSAGTGVMSVWTPIDFSQGSFVSTQSATDLMLEGQSFFAIRAEGEEEIFYTRSGSFIIDQEDYLLTVDSSTGRRWQVLNDQQQPLRVTDWDRYVDSEGNFHGTGQRIGVVNFGDLMAATEAGTQPLLKVGNNRYQINQQADTAPTWLQAADMGAEKVVQGGLEGSNVNSVREMVSLISATRSYESSQKVIQMTDQTLAQANEIGKV